MREEIKEAEDEINCKIDNALTQLTDRNGKFDQLEKAMKDCSARLDIITSNFLPKISDNMKQLPTALTIKILDKDVHKRK